MAPSPERADGARSSDFVQSLERGLAVIRAFGAGRERLSLSDVARETGLTRAAARRFLLTLAALGYVRSDGREFSLRPRVLELGYAYLSGLDLPQVAGPYLEDLAERVRETSVIAVLDGQHVVSVAARVPARRLTAVSVQVGASLPAHATSMGRVLLAGLPDGDLDRYLAEAGLESLTGRTVTDPVRLGEIIRDVRRQGFGIVDQELEDGLRSDFGPRARRWRRLHRRRQRCCASRPGQSGGHAGRGAAPHCWRPPSRIEADLRSQRQG